MNNYLGKRASDINIDQATNRIRNILHTVDLEFQIVSFLDLTVVRQK